MSELAQLAAVGETLRVDHGDKVTERYIVAVSETNVRSRSRWISGTPYVNHNPNSHFEWDCTPEKWAEHVSKMKDLGKVVGHRRPHEYRTDQQPAHQDCRARNARRPR